MATTSALPTFSVLYAFGDSLSDAGNLSLATDVTGGVVPVSPPYYRETYYDPVIGTDVSANVFSNGPTWVQNLSVTLGLGTLAPSLLDGNDFAYGGAETGATPQNADDAEIDAISLPSQLVQFEAGVSHPSPDALYTLSIGSNDLLDILADTSLTAAQQTTDVDDAVNNEIGFVDSLVGYGAEHLLVLNVPDLGKTPDVMDGLANGTSVASAAFDSLASSLASEYNADLTSQLATVHGANVTVVNAYQLIDDAVASPSAYGLSNVTSPVWTGSYSVPGSGTLASTVTATQDQYLFWDHLHPTETGELAVASLAEADLSNPCFAAGTRIATPNGEMMVQDLCIGDLVRLADGGTAPVVWLGYRRVFCRHHPHPTNVLPVRIAAHAFGLGRPARDVLMSPDHAVFMEGVLIPVRYLLTDATVRQEDVDTITYWHVELATHGVLLAEGLPAESYLDTGNRSAFTNGGKTAMAHPDFARGVWERAGCAPLVTAGPARDIVYRRLVAQALALGWELTDAGGGAVNWLPPKQARTAA
jgi:phospholipase/lecithinase/hemolysin